MRYTIVYKGGPAVEDHQPLPNPVVEPSIEPFFPTIQTGPKSFLDLPAEIRLRVYSCCFARTVLLIGGVGWRTYYRYTQAIANTTNLNPGVQLERHDTAIALLCINKQIYLEAWPCLLHELLVFCVTADRATHDFLRSSFDPPHQLQSERRLLASPTAHPFTTIKSLRIGDFANLKHGRHSITHKMQQIRMLSTIKYSMPQLQHLALEVQYPSGMWVQSTLKNRLWYLESLSQLHVLKTFRFGCFNTKEYIAVYKKDSPMDTQRKLAVSCRSVLSGLVTASPKISHDNLQNWQALGRQVSPTVNTGEEAWKVIKNEMQTGSWGYTRASARLLLPRFSYN